MLTLTEKLVSHFNFDEKEARVYLASLSLGRAKVSEIAKKAGLNRITTYEILKRLNARGLASAINYEKVQYFQVLSPDRLVEKMERQASLAQSYLPELLLLKNNGQNRPKVEYYEGVEGIRAIYEETLNCQEKVIYNIAAPENVFPFVGADFIESYIKRRLRRKLLVKILLPDTEANRAFSKKSKAELREARFLDNGKFPIPNEIMIYDNKIILLSFSAQLGVVVEDKDIALSLKSIWQLLWQNAKTH